MLAYLIQRLVIFFCHAAVLVAGLRRMKLV
jgi:hypothetical protein